MSPATPSDPSPGTASRIRISPKLALLLASALVLATALWAVLGMERTLRHGQTVLVQLAPVDPRSLMQGDYMALSFDINRQLPNFYQLRRDEAQPRLPRYVYLRVDEQGRASFGSLGNTLPAPPSQVALQIRFTDWRASVGPNAFFFQEGSGPVYEQAKWGELRVAADGKALLAALRDAELQVLGVPRR